MPADQKLLTGKTLAFTGALSMTRKEAIAMAERSGATVVDAKGSVTKAVTHIVIGGNVSKHPKSSNKMKKAQADGIEAWTEEEFIRKMTVEDTNERLGENKGRRIEQTAKTGYQFSLAWYALVDLDLKIETPKGLVYYGERKVAGAELDVDRIPGMGRSGRSSVE